MYLVLVTNKSSNILEDLETLRLCGKVVPEYVEALEEEEVGGWVPAPPGWLVGRPAPLVVPCGAWHVGVRVLAAVGGAECAAMRELHDSSG